MNTFLRHRMSLRYPPDSAGEHPWFPVGRPAGDKPGSGTAPSSPARRTGPGKPGRAGAEALTAHPLRTSSTRTTRRSASDNAHASAIQLASIASATVHGDVARPATTSVKAVSSAR